MSNDDILPGYIPSSSTSKPSIEYGKRKGNTNNNSRKLTTNDDDNSIVLQQHRSNSTIISRLNDNNDYDDDDSNDVDDGDNNTHYSRTSSVKFSKIDRTKLGTLVSMPQCSQVGTRQRDIAPIHITYQVRSYLNHLFGAIACAEEYCYDIFGLIPYVVDAILRYNNISFKTVQASKTDYWLIEPIWYSYDVVCNQLNLYIYEQLWNDYLLTKTELPVIYKGWIVPVERLDPYQASSNNNRQTSRYYSGRSTRQSSRLLEEVAMKIAVACDHVSQHIIHCISHNNELNPMATLHDGWTECPGTTLHSMLQIGVVRKSTGGLDRDSLMLNSSTSQTRFTDLINLG
jgi:hypothetical protein